MTGDLQELAAPTKRPGVRVDEGPLRLALATAKQGVARADDALKVARRAYAKSTEIEQRVATLTSRVDVETVRITELQRAVTDNTNMARDGRDAALRAEYAVRHIRLSLGWKLLAALSTVGSIAAASTVVIMDAAIRSFVMSFLGG